MREFVLYDPRAEYLPPPLQGHRLAGDASIPMEMDDTGALVSRELGMRLALEGGWLQFYDPRSGDRLLAPAERAALAEARAAAAEERAAAEAEVRRLIEARIAALEARIAELEARLRGAPPT